MSEVGGFESFDAPAAGEASEQSQEQFREQAKQAQIAARQQKKEEGKARKNDDKLAQIIVQFLARTDATDLFLLISRCVAQNIPSELVIAVLSLIDQTAFTEMGKIASEAENINALAVAEQNSIHNLSEEQRQAIDQWLKNIGIAAAHKPHRTLENVLIKKRAERTDEIFKEISPPFLQLSTFIMRNFLAMDNTQVDYEILHDFMQSAYLKMLLDLEAFVKGQRHLESSS